MIFNFQFFRGILVQVQVEKVVKCNDHMSWNSSIWHIWFRRWCWYTFGWPCNGTSEKHNIRMAQKKSRQWTRPASSTIIEEVPLRIKPDLADRINKHSSPREFFNLYKWAMGWNLVSDWVIQCTKKHEWRLP